MARLLVGLDSLGLEVSPLRADQENSSRLRGGVYHWEGAVIAKDSHGRIVGRGYIELPGYGRDNKPPV